MNAHFSPLIIFVVLLLSLVTGSYSRVAMRKDDFLLEVVANDGDLCTDVISSTNMGPLHPICENMVPRSGLFQAQSASTSPWKIYTWKSEIQQYVTHPIVLGSDDGVNKFVNYIVAAKAVIGGHFVGHFEYQWDAIPFCCYPPNKNHSYEGSRLHPNLLVGAQGVRVQTPNQTVLWTAPKSFVGPVIFVATFWKSGKLYWPNVTSSPVQVINRDLKKQIFSG